MPRSTITRTSIVDAAFAQLADGGLDSITARALAARLGVRAGALYYHLRDMGELRDEMATRVLRALLERGVAAAGTTWDELLRTGARRMRAVLLGYRDGARLVAGTYLLDDEALRMTEAPLRILVDAGMPPLDAQRALTTMTAWVTGFVIEEEQRRAAESAGDPRYDPATRRARLDPKRQPLNDELSDEVVWMSDASFEWGLDVLVHGIGQRVGLRLHAAG